jgi:hypothetical protein
MFILVYPVSEEENVFEEILPTLITPQPTMTSALVCAYIPLD